MVIVICELSECVCDELLLGLCGDDFSNATH